MPKIMSLPQAVPDILLTRFHRFTMQKSKKGHTSAIISPVEKKTRRALVLSAELEQTWNYKSTQCSRQKYQEQI